MKVMKTKTVYYSPWRDIGRAHYDAVAKLLCYRDRYRDTADKPVTVRRTVTRNTNPKGGGGNPSKVIRGSEVEILYHPDGSATIRHRHLSADDPMSR